MDEKRKQRIHSDTWHMGVWMGRATTAVFFLCLCILMIVGSYVLIRLMLGACGGL